MSFGHVIIKENGSKCTCGNYGCFEAYASMRNFKDKIAKKLGLKDYIGQEIYDVLAICLGGGFVHYKDILLPKLIDELKTNDMTYNKEIPQIVTAKMR